MPTTSTACRRLGAAGRAAARRPATVVAAGALALSMTAMPSFAGELPCVSSSAIGLELVIDLGADRADLNVELTGLRKVPARPGAAPRAMPRGGTRFGMTLALTLCGLLGLMNPMAVAATLGGACATPGRTVMSTSVGEGLLLCSSGAWTAAAGAQTTAQDRALLTLLGALLTASTAGNACDATTQPFGRDGGNNLLRCDPATNKWAAVGGGSSAGSSSAPSASRVYVNPGTYPWTAPAGVTQVRVLAVGGGGGGASAARPYGASGAGSGNVVQGVVTVTPGQVVPVEVGAGGQGRNYGNGANGGRSAFGTSVIAAGGTGGRGGGWASAIPGGAGGSGGGGGNNVGGGFGGTGGTDGASGGNSADGVSVGGTGQGGFPLGGFTLASFSPAGGGRQKNLAGGGGGGVLMNSTGPDNPDSAYGAENGKGYGGGAAALYINGSDPGAYGLSDQVTASSGAAGLVFLEW